MCAHRRCHALVLLRWSLTPPPGLCITFSNWQFVCACVPPRLSLRHPFLVAPQRVRWSPCSRVRHVHSVNAPLSLLLSSISLLATGLGEKQIEQAFAPLASTLSAGGMTAENGGHGIHDRKQHRHHQHHQQHHDHHRHGGEPRGIILGRDLGGRTGKIYILFLLSPKVRGGPRV